MANYTVDINVNFPEKEGYEANFPEGDGTATSEVSGKKRGKKPKTAYERFQGAYSTFAKAVTGGALGKQIFSGFVSRVGKYTGSTDTQQKWDFWSGIAAQAGGVVTAAVMGGSAAAAMAVAAVGVNYAFKAADYAYDRRWESIELQQGRLRAGPSFNRSRS